MGKSAEIGEKRTRKGGDTWEKVSKNRWKRLVEPHDRPSEDPAKLRRAAQAEAHEAIRKPPEERKVPKVTSPEEIGAMLAEEQRKLEEKRRARGVSSEKLKQWATSSEEPILAPRKIPEKTSPEEPILAPPRKFPGKIQRSKEASRLEKLERINQRTEKAKQGLKEAEESEGRDSPAYQQARNKRMALMRARQRIRASLAEGGVEVGALGKLKTK